jgi:hypothetical protein
MAKLSTAERAQIARTRLIRVLDSHGIANWRTLEQKISDAGPGAQRVDPHILTPVRRTLEKQGVIVRHVFDGTPWFALAATPAPVIETRLAVQRPVHQALQNDNIKKRIGQTLEIAIYRALIDQTALADYLGQFLDLHDHDDSSLYSKEEPPRKLGKNYIGGDRRLDFLVRHPTAGWAGIEAKNIREWLYPDREEILELLSKCVALDVIPVLIGRRIHFSSFVVLNACGVVIHQTFNQLFPTSETALAEKAKHKDNLGYHDIRTGNAPHPRLTEFISNHLPSVLPDHRQKFDEYKDPLEAFADGDMTYVEFAARVRRRKSGVAEDYDDPEPDELA